MHGQATLLRAGGLVRDPSATMRSCTEGAGRRGAHVTPPTLHTAQLGEMPSQPVVGSTANEVNIVDGKSSTRPHVVRSRVNRIPQPVSQVSAHSLDPP